MFFDFFFYESRTTMFFLTTFNNAFVIAAINNLVLHVLRPFNCDAVEIVKNLPI